MLRALLAGLVLAALPAQAAEDTLYLYTWNNYIGEATARRFEARCGCRLRQDFYADNEEMLAKLDAGAEGYDLLVPTGNAVEALIRRGALRPIDKSRLPHLANTRPAYLDRWYDPGNAYSVPYAYTVTLLGFNATKLRALGVPTGTWAALFEPRHLEKLRGRVTVLNSPRELLAAAMIYLGFDPQDADPAKWEAAKALVLRAKPYWATFSNSTYIKDLAVGNVWLVHGYSNDAFRAREDAKAARRPFEIAYEIPSEGAVLAVDNFVLHKSGRRPDLAHAFIDFMLEGENAADVANLIGAGTPNAAAEPFLRPEIAGDPAIFPTAREMARLAMLRDFDAKARRRLARLWTEVKVK